MTINEVIYSICAANNYKPYPDVMPEPKDGIVYSLISNQRRYSLSGDSKFFTAVYQFTIFNKVKKVADSQAFDLIDIFHQSTGLYENIRLLSARVGEEQEDYEEQTKLNVKMFELTIIYRKN